MSELKEQHIAQGILAVRITDGTEVADITSGGAFNVASLNQLVNVEHDEKVFTWTAGDLTQIVYKKASATVATVTLTWTAGDLTRMVVT